MLGLAKKINNESLVNFVALYIGDYSIVLMTQPDNTYKIQRTCTICGLAQPIFVTKREAAFELFDMHKIHRQNCTKCLSTSFSTVYEKPDLDFDLLKEWATNPDLYLMKQDEELLLADKRYLDMILEILDTMPLPDHKRNLLMDALCVIVYDNSNNKNPQQDEQLKKRVITELNKRQDKLKLADNWIMDYIKRVVYPQLDFNKRTV